MKKTLKILFTICLTLTLNLISCTKEDEIQIEERYKLNLTLKEKQEDYEYFWDFIYNGYPMIEVIQRRGVDLEKIKNDNYEKLAKLKSKNAYMQFYAYLCYFITDEQSTGHLGAINYNRFDLAHRGRYPVIDKNGLNTIIANFYIDKGIDDSPPEFKTTERKDENKESSKVKNNKIETKSDTRTYNYVFADTEIIEKDKIAYLRIDSFWYNTNAEKKAYYKALDNFFTETQNYKHLVIDVSHNRGGYPRFWEYIVGVHLRKKDIDNNIYGLYSENKYTEPYLDRYLKHFKRGIDRIDAIDIDLVPNVKNANTKLHKKAYRLTTRIQSIYSPDQKPREDRKIWVLISKECYSGTDRFANFCRQADWATLVGENTSGLGSCLWSPEAFALPKSGLLILWDLGYGLNPDGTCNDEFGIAPDIYTEKGKTALETCLDAIKEYDEKNGE